MYPMPDCCIHYPNGLCMFASSISCGAKISLFFAVAQNELQFLLFFFFWKLHRATVIKFITVALKLHRATVIKFITVALCKFFFAVHES